LIWIFDVRKWELVSDWDYKVPDGPHIILHKGFLFDGASIPRIFWAILSPTGLLLIPGLIHDYGYRYDQLFEIKSDGQIVPYKKGAGKRQWDKMFKHVAKKVNGMVIIHFIAWLAVVVGGKKAWEKNQARGEQPKIPIL
jgi:hypothetical protein